MAGWRDIHIGPENDRLSIGGVPVWKTEWRWVDAKTITLPNPLIDDEHLSYMICEVGNKWRPVRFAAAQLPSGLWAFYVPEAGR